MSDIEDRISEALSTRLRHDRPNRFDPDTWLDDTFDKYYPDESFVDLAVLQETQNVCSADQLIMPAEVKQALAGEVNLDSSGQDAIDAMVDAHANAEPRSAARAGVTSNQLLAEHLHDLASSVVALGFAHDRSADRGKRKKTSGTSPTKRSKKRGRE